MCTEKCTAPNSGALKMHEYETFLASCRVKGKPYNLNRR